VDHSIAPTMSRGQKRVIGDGASTTSIQGRGEKSTSGKDASTATTTPYSIKNGSLGLAIRTRVSVRLRSGATQTGNPNSWGKLVVDLTGNHPKIQEVDQHAHGVLLGV